MFAQVVISFPRNVIKNVINPFMHILDIGLEISKKYYLLFQLDELY